MSCTSVSQDGIMGSDLTTTSYGLQTSTMVAVVEHRTNSSLLCKRTKPSTITTERLKGFIRLYRLISALARRAKEESVDVKEGDRQGLQAKEAVEGTDQKVLENQGSRQSALCGV